MQAVEVLGADRGYPFGRYGRRSEKKWLTSDENDVLSRIEIDFRVNAG
jgi:hypothetical protein